MSEYNERTWLEALAKVYERARFDAVYRALCLANPIEAIKEVSDIELPPEIRVQFFSDPKTMLYTYLLPPEHHAGATEEENSQSLIDWATFCTTFPTTND